MSEETVRDDLVVALAYELRVDGEVVDQASVAEPFEYLHGALNIVPGLEAALAGHRVGDRFEVSVPPDQGYGQHDPEDIEWFDKDDFDDGTALEPGSIVSIEYDDDEGEFIEGTVSEVSENRFAVDFNHPLAGKTLDFSVEVVSVRPAEREELEQGHPHGDYWDEEDWDDWDDADEDDWLDEEEDPASPRQA